MILLARIISILASPLLLTAPIAFALVYRVTPDLTYALTWMAISMLFALTIGSFILVGVRRGLFSDFDISIREERKPVFIFAGIVAFLYLIAIFLLSGPVILMAAIVAFVLGTSVNGYINLRIKSSIHMAVFSAFATGVGVLYGGPFWLFVLLIPLVAWSRITLKRHTLKETVVGTLIGVSLVLLLYLAINYLLLI